MIHNAVHRLGYQDLVLDFSECTAAFPANMLGVCAQVAPWNYPMMMAVWKFAPAIAAGNTVVLKPSDTTPASTTRLAEIAAEFLPAGVLNVICGDRDTGRAMVEHETPAMVSVTGSVRAGQEVAAAASLSLKRVHLELGGKAPVVVFDDADLESAAEGIASELQGFAVGILQRAAELFDAEAFAAGRVQTGSVQRCGPWPSRPHRPATAPGH